MGTGALDPVIHAPARLRIVATLKALPTETRCPSPACKTCSTSPPAT